MQFKEKIQTTSIQDERIVDFESFLYQSYSAHTWVQENEGNCEIQKLEVSLFDLSIVDRQANVKNGELFLLARQDLFDRTADAEGMKTEPKFFNETVAACYLMLQKSFNKKIEVNKCIKSWRSTSTHFNEKI